MISNKAEISTVGDNKIDTRLAIKFCHDLITAIDDHDRYYQSLGIFYADEAELIVEGCVYQYRGSEQVTHALIDMFEGLKIVHEIIDVVYDPRPSYYVDNQVICKSTIQIEDDIPRNITEIFHLHRHPDDKLRAEQLICSKHYFIVTDPRPLYIHDHQPPFIPPEEESEYDSQSDSDDSDGDNSGH